MTGVDQKPSGSLSFTPVTYVPGSLFPLPQHHIPFCYNISTMNNIPKIAVLIASIGFALAVGVGAWWLITHKSNTSASDKPTPPATVDKVKKEDELNTVVLTEEAEKRIGLTLATVEKKKVNQVRMYGGEVTVPAGRTIIVSAPLTGVLKAPPSGEIKAGQTVKTGQVIFHLTPLLTPDGRATLSASLADAEGQVNNAKTQANLTKIALDRANRVLKEGAGSQRQVDEAQAAYDQAAKTLDATVARQSILKKVIGDAESGTTNPIPIEVPEGGILRTVSALPGQSVPSGTALFEVVDLSTVWVRVPLPVGDADMIDRNAVAQVGKLSTVSSTLPSPAKPIPAPPSANPLAATVDVFYELANTDSKLTPGQRLGVTIPLGNANECRTIPWSAIVFDINGGTWVYVQTATHTYTRRRVLVSHTEGENAILADTLPDAPTKTPAIGPSVGAKIVTAGTHQLFGAETGFVK